MTLFHRVQGSSLEPIDTIKVYQAISWREELRRLELRRLSDFAISSGGARDPESLC